MDTTVDLLAAQPFLKGLTQHQLGLLAPLTTRTMFHAGNRIFREDTPAEQFWLISDGRVDLDSEVPGYDNLVLDSLAAGAVLGWSWMFPPYRWHFGAVATQTTYAVTFNAALVGFRNAAATGELGFYAARSYSVISPARIGHRLTRSYVRSAGGRSDRGGCSSSDRCGRRPL